MPSADHVTPEGRDLQVNDLTYFKRPDSLGSLASLNSASSGYSSTSRGCERQLSVTSLSSLTIEDGDLQNVRTSPDSEEDSGLQMILYGKNKLQNSRSSSAVYNPLPEDQQTLISSLKQTTFETQKKLNHDQKTVARKQTLEKHDHIPAEIQFYVNLSLSVLKFFGRVRETFSSTLTIDRPGYPALLPSDDFNGFHHRNIWSRWQDCFSTPVDSAATDMISLMERTFPSANSTKHILTGKSQRYINLGSYNYLGFGGVGECSRQASKITKSCGVAAASTCREVGTQRPHVELEELVAEFLGVEAAVVFGMGFATNSTGLPSLVGRGCLVLSDSLNHASLILGLRLSGATVRVFKHNDMEHLERQLVRAVTEDAQPWNKILIAVEGVYSMEGSVVLLPDVIRLKKRYGAYLYLDEAHSVGAIGESGRGVVEYCNCNPHDVDVLMGTFTKSFGASGGYIAGTKRMVDHVRMYSHSSVYATAQPAAVCQQIISSMRIIMGRDGSDVGRRKISTLARNSRFIRQRLRQLGFIVYGNDDSPVVPLLGFFISKMAALHRRLKDYGIAAVVIGYPAAPLDKPRARFCISASHTQQQLEYIVEVMNKLGDELAIKLSKEPRSQELIVY